MFVCVEKILCQGEMYVCAFCEHDCFFLPFPGAIACTDPWAALSRIPCQDGKRERERERERIREC